MARLRGGRRPGRRGADAGHCAGAERVVGDPAASDAGTGAGDGREPRPLPAGGRSGLGGLEADKVAATSVPFARK